MNGGVLRAPVVKGFPRTALRPVKSPLSAIGARPIAVMR